MATAVILPHRGQNAESGLILKWYRRKGDAVTAGEPLFSYETDLAVFDENAGLSGTLLEILTDEGEEAPCLTPIAVIGTPGEDISGLLAACAPSAEEENKFAETETKPSVETSDMADRNAGRDDLPRVSPRARELALREGADLSRAAATGPNGRIIERDVSTVLDDGFLTAREALRRWLDGDREALTRAFEGEKQNSPDETPAEAPAPVEAPAEEASAEAPAPAEAPAEEAPAEAPAPVKWMTLNRTFDAEELLAFRDRLAAEGKMLGLAEIGLCDMIAFAAARSAAKVPALNGGSCETCLSVEDGNGTAVIPHAGERSLNAFALARAEKSGSDGPVTFAVVDYGSFGIESFTLPPAEASVAALGVGCVCNRWKTVNGGPKPCRQIRLSLTFPVGEASPVDGCRFLSGLCGSLEHFGLLLAL